MNTIQKTRYIGTTMLQVPGSLIRQMVRDWEGMGIGHTKEEISWTDEEGRFQSAGMFHFQCGCKALAKAFDNMIQPCSEHRPLFIVGRREE